MKRFTLLPFFALFAAACQDMPTQPKADEAAPPPPATLTIALSPDQAVAVTASLDDAMDRLLPASAPGQDDALALAFRAAEAALERSDGAGFQRAISEARQALARARQENEDGIAADLDAAGLVLDQAEAVVSNQNP